MDANSGGDRDEDAIGVEIGDNHSHGDAVSNGECDEALATSLLTFAAGNH